MGSMKDLLGDTPFYPSHPGFKKIGTSEAAARAVGASRKLPERKRAILDAFAASPAGLNADEAAGVLGLSVLYVRPRVTELARAKPPLLVDTGATRKNKSGLSATVWRTP